MTTTFKILFMVEMLHEYYSNLQSSDFSIIPSADTAAMMKNQQLIYKVVGNKLVVLAKIQTEGPNIDKPFVELVPAKRFLFYLDLNNSLFTTITNLDADLFRQRKRFYFTNLYENKAGTALHLSAKIDNYANGTFYKPGDMADNGAGIVFENIKLSPGGNDTTNTNFWAQRGAKQFVSSKDMLSFVTAVHTYETTIPAKQFSIKVFGLNIVNGLYDKEIPITKSSFTCDKPTQMVQVDLSELPPARYKVRINTTEFDVYIDNVAVYNNMVGVIEIFNHLPLGSDFSFFDGTGKLKDIIVAGNAQWLMYRVHFANRLAYWKYLTPKKGVKSIKDNTNVYTFPQTPALPAAADYFQSNFPIPIKQSPAIYDLELNNPISNEPPAAPNPDPHITGMLSRKDPEKDYYCNIYLNY